MSDKKYFLRWKGAMMGPFSDREVLARLESGRITKHHQISSDEAEWVSLSESVDFGLYCRGNHATDPAVRVHGMAETSMQQSPARLRLQADAEVESVERWYYVDNGQAAGPVDLSALQDLVWQGTVLPTSPICREDDDKWVHAGELLQGRLRFQRTFGGRDAFPGPPQGTVPYATPAPITAASAVWSLVLGILGIVPCLGLAGSIPAIVCGHVARGTIRRSTAYCGNGMATAGLVLGYIGLVGSLATGLIIAVPSFMSAREQSMAMGCVNNLRIIDAAKEQAAMEQGWEQGKVIPHRSAAEQSVLEYIKGGMPECPAGGTYTWNAIGYDPECSLGDSHAL